jgi:hypothetical protein
MKRTALLALGLASGLALGSAPSTVAAPVDSAGSSLDVTPIEPGGGLTVAEARAAAEEILKAVQSRDPNRRFSQFSDELQAVSSPSMVAETIRTQPQILSWNLLSVRRGLHTSTVEASLNTSAGPMDLFMVLNDEGKLDGYHIDRTDDQASRVAADFVRAISSGHFISARSYLSLPLQKELTVARLQNRWQQLQRYTGNFVRVRKVVEAERTADSQLVLVHTEFNRVSDSLFVILDSNNEIVGVDFPHDTPQPSRVETPVP